MRFYQQFIANQLYILVPLLIRLPFLFIEIQKGLTFRIILGYITVTSLVGAYYFFYKNKILKNILTQVGFLSLSLSPILTMGGLADSTTPIYILGFAIFTLWTLGVEQTRSVLISTCILISIAIIHYFSGYAQIMDVNDDQYLLGIPLISLIGSITSLAALYFLVNDYRKKNNKLIDITIKQEQFISHLNHEMRNPLQGIKGVLDILKNHQIPAERFDYLLDNAIRTTEHLNDMVNEVLSLKQLRSGMFSDSPVPHNIRDIVDTTIFIYKEQAHQKGLKFNVNYDEDLPEQLFIPNKSLKIVLSNLTSNAVKYTAQGEINIDVSFTQGMLTLSVQDTGIGIPKTLTDKIFDEYYQVDQRLTKDFQGTGIGLSIVKPLISRLEGSITAHSTLNEGSTFTVTFPCKLVLQSKSSLASSAVKQHHKLPNLAGTSILVVEDNMINRAILKEQLEACGASITEAENGAEALDLIKINHFDVVLSDIAMPILDGVSLVKTVRQFDPQLIMVAISGNTLHNEITAYYDAGFNYVLSKPYNTEKLYDIILKVRKRQLIKS